MHIKYRKIIFFIAAFIVICLALSNRSASSQTISIDKEIYYVGDVIRIRYSSIPGEKNERGWYTRISYWISVNSAEGRIKLGSTFDCHVLGSPHYSRAFPGKNTTSGVLEIDTKDMEGAWIARDFTVTLGRSEDVDKGTVTKALITKHFRLRQPKYKTIPGALSLRGGNRFKLGDSIIADVNLPPSIKISHLTEGLSIEGLSSVTAFHFRIKLYYLNRKTHGGAIQPNQRVVTGVTLENNSTTIESHSVEKVIVDQVKGTLSPGIYELRLIRESNVSYNESYVVDSVRFEIVFESWPESLKVVSTDDFKVGEVIKIQLDSAAVPFQDYASSSFKDRLEVYLYKVINDLETMEPVDHVIDGVYLQGIAESYERIVSTGQDIIFMPVKQAGKYVIMLQTDFLSNPLYEDDHHLAFRGYILDHLEIDVAKRKEATPSPPFEVYVGTGNKSRFIPGEKIPIEVYYMQSDQMPGGTTLVVTLKHNEPDAGYDNGEPIGRQIKEWDVEIGKKQAWTVPGDLAIGSYNLVLKATSIVPTRGGEKKYTGVAGVASFQVVPEFNSVRIDMKNRNEYFYGETIKFDVIFPESINSDNFELQYEIKRKGGFVPGCARVLDYWVKASYGNIKGGLRNISFIAPPPGRYGLKIFGILLDRIPKKSVLLAEELFTSDLQWQPGALSFPSQKTEFLYGEEIHVAVDAHADLGMRDMGSGSATWIQKLKKVDGAGKYMLYLFRQGDAGYGGAYRYPWDTRQVVQAVAPKDNFVLKKERNTPWLLPGAYEFRLYNKRKERRASFLVSRLPFYVTEPQSPFSIEKGKPGVPQPSDLESPGLFYGLRIGEFLGADSCGTLLKPEVESMTLAFVKWDEDQHKYVPIEGALEFGQSFYIEGKLEEEAGSNFYAGEIPGPSGRAQEVILWADEDDMTVVRSERLYSIWEDAGGGE